MQEGKRAVSLVPPEEAVPEALTGPGALKPSGWLDRKPGTLLSHSDCGFPGSFPSSSRSLPVAAVWKGQMVSKTSRKHREPNWPGPPHYLASLDVGFPFDVHL